MRRMLVAILVGAVVIGVGIAAQAQRYWHYEQWGQVTGYLSTGDADYWYFTLQEDHKYKFTVSMPYSADYDMKLYRDFNYDGYLNDEGYFDTLAGERVASSTSSEERPEILEFTAFLTGRFDMKIYSYRGYGSYTFTIYEWVYGY